MRQQITDVNARSWVIPSVLIRMALSLVISAVVLAMLVPALHAKGQSLTGWMVWGVILAALSIPVLPGLLRRLRKL